ncbi:MAG: MBL fold metallo-hydrolase [Candidatus Dormibacteria bacterium]
MYAIDPAQSVAITTDTFEEDRSMAVVTPDASPALDLTPIPPAVHHEPLQLADDVFLVRQLEGEGTRPMCLAVNSLVIAGDEPVIVDTGARSNRQQWLEDVFSIVEPRDVRWIYISHDDVDHIGNLGPVLEACPNARLIVNWLMWQRTAAEMRLPLARMRWVDDGEHFTAGDRTLVALRPPTFDSPTTRGLFDTKSRIYWATDSFGALVPHHVDRVSDLPLETFQMGFTGFNRTMAPWVALVDEDKFANSVQAIRALEPSCIASCHGPVLDPPQFETAYSAMEHLPAAPAMPMPGQEQLEAMLDAITHGTAGASH